MVKTVGEYKYGLRIYVRRCKIFRQGIVVKITVPWLQIILINKHSNKLTISHMQMSLNPFPHIDASASDGFLKT